MSERVIPLHVQSSPVLALPVPAPASGAELRDALGRPLRDLRISVTDRCNFRCGYCMPRTVFDGSYPYLPHADLLRFEEITRLAQAFVGLGVRKLRLTGGEPLLRKGIETLIEQLAALRTPDGAALDLTLTTNASLLARKAHSLRAAGLRRVTVSLDALDPALFARMSDSDCTPQQVLAGIEAAYAAGLGPIKVNMVVQRGVNDSQILPMVRHFRGTPVALRFIEYMDVGCSNGWRMEQVLPSAEVQALIASEFELVRLPESAAGETAQRWGYAGVAGRHAPELGEIGFISSVTQAFCHDCNRARLSTDGKLFLCLFAAQGYNFRALLRQSASADVLGGTLRAIWQQRSERYSQLRASALALAGTARADVALQRQPARIEMSYIGG